MLNNLGLANKVKLHLTHSVQWSNIVTRTLQLQKTDNNDNNDNSFGNFTNEAFVLKGDNPKTGLQEYVLPLSKRLKLTLQDIDNLFGNIEKVEGLKNGAVEKILFGIVDTDGSILFYYVHRGVKNFSG